MHTYDAHGLPYFISCSGVMQFREAFYTVGSHAPYVLLQIYTITILATFLITIFDFFLRWAAAYMYFYFIRSIDHSKIKLLAFKFSIIL